LLESGREARRRLGRRKDAVLVLGRELARRFHRGLEVVVSVGRRFPRGQVRFAFGFVGSRVRRDRRLGVGLGDDAALVGCATLGLRFPGGSRFPGGLRFPAWVLLLRWLATPEQGVPPDGPGRCGMCGGQLRPRRPPWALARSSRIRRDPVWRAPWLRRAAG